MDKLLDVRHLTVRVTTSDGALAAVNDVSFHIGVGETVGLVGESGSGKTLLSKAILRLDQFVNGTSVEGEIRLEGADVLCMSARRLRDLRGRKIAMIFQEPMSAFDPVFTIGQQIVETIQAHKTANARHAVSRAVYLLHRVGIPDPEIRMKQYPGELSGGLLQRAMIALALACGPDLLIADEPTTALDMTVQAQILKLLQELREEFRMSILLITHDLGVAAEMADRIIVMYAGEMVEQAEAGQLFANPLHPYTAGLLHSVDSLESGSSERLLAIDGSIPSLVAPPAGCRFHPRCPYATEKCAAEAPTLRELGGREAACWYAGHLNLADADLWANRASVSDAAAEAAASSVKAALMSRNSPKEEPLIEVIDVHKLYPVKKRFLSPGRFLRAVDGVTFTIRKGETFGLVGESGSGKSTLGRLILQLERETSGEVTYAGQPITRLNNHELRDVRRNMQMIFQDPYGSMNPRWTVGDIVGEPLAIHTASSARERRDGVCLLLEQVGLDGVLADRYPHELSGGQRQRVGIARAIALKPSFILADEAVSALDVSVQAQIVNLMQHLQQTLGLTYLFIAHGLSVVRHISNRIGVMYLGRLVEIADSEELFLRPAHHYTRALIASIPRADPANSARKREQILGEIPSPASPPSGCRFHPRCPAATAHCREEAPELRTLGRDHAVACHYPA